MSVSPKTLPACRLLTAALPWVFCIGLACESSWERNFRKNMEASKRQSTSLQIRNVALPFFSKYTYDDNQVIPSSEVPKEITSLPIFAEDPQNIRVNWPLGYSNALNFSIGGGFGAWGLVVLRVPDDDSLLKDQYFSPRLTAWGDGVYFYRQ